MSKKGSASSSSSSPSVGADEKSTGATEEPLQVFLRVRPPHGRRAASAKKSKFRIDSTTKLSVLANEASAKSADEAASIFSFSHIFGPKATQEEMFENVGRNAVEALFDEKSALLFAYGMTSSGKTHSIAGNAKQPGLLPRALQSIFDRIAKDAEIAKQNNVLMSCLEIYQGKLRDLLKPTRSDKEQLSIKSNRSHEIYVPNLTEVAVEDIDGANEVLANAAKERNVADTKLNMHSSRSHAMYTIKLVPKGVTQDPTGSKCISRLCVVDLAGAERNTQTGSRAGTARFDEAVKINNSLVVLGRCLEALRHNQQTSNARQHSMIPFRETPITRLLQSFFEGTLRSPRIFMLATVSFEDRNFDDTFRVLKYAAVAREVKCVSKVLLTRNAAPQAPQLGVARTPFKRSHAHMTPRRGTAAGNPEYPHTTASKRARTHARTNAHAHAAAAANAKKSDNENCEFLIGKLEHYKDLLRKERAEHDGYKKYHYRYVKQLKVAVQDVCQRKFYFEKKRALREQREQLAASDPNEGTFELKEKVLSLQKQIESHAATKSELEAARKRASDLQAALDGERRSREREVSALREEISELEEKFGEAHANALRSERERVQALQSELDRVRSQPKDATSKLARADTQMKILQKELSASRALVASKADEVGRLRAQILELETQVVNARASSSPSGSMSSSSSSPPPSQTATSSSSSSMRDEPTETPRKQPGSERDAEMVPPTADTGGQRKEEATHAQKAEAGEDSDVEIVEVKTTMPKSKKRKSEGPFVRATPAKKKRMQIRVRKSDGTRRTQRDLTKLTVAKLKEELKGYGIDTKGMRLKKHFVARLLELINEEWARMGTPARGGRAPGATPVRGRAPGATPARGHAPGATPARHAGGAANTEGSQSKTSERPLFAVPAPTPRIARRTRSKRRKQ